MYGEIGYTAADASRTIRLPKNVEETNMAVDGNWNLTMSTPMGERQGDAVAEKFGQNAHGHTGRRRHSAEIFDGTTSGNDVAWKVSLTNPMPLTLAFTGKVSGDSIAGEMGIGPMGTFPFTGTRA